MRDDYFMTVQTLLAHLVTVDSARGPIRRTVIAETDAIVVLDEPEGVKQAKTFGITRFSIGFRREDILSVDGIDKTVCLKHNVQYEQAAYRQTRPDPLAALRGYVDAVCIADRRRLDQHLLETACGRWRSVRHVSR